MRILVTGGAGYIGSHTVLELLKDGNEVVVIDDLSNGHLEALQRVEALSNTPVVLHKVDIRDIISLDVIFQEFKPDAVVHFAGLKAVGESVAQPLRYYDTNICGTINILCAMDRVNCRRIVFSSSATVYGSVDVPPYNERSNTQPVNPYGHTKLMAEQIIKDWAFAAPDRFGLVLRYFNPIGAHPSGQIGEHPVGIPNNLMPYIAQVAIGQRPHLSVFGKDYETRDGTGERDYIHVVDLAMAHVAAVLAERQEKGFEVFNLGTGRGTTVLELVNEFERCSGLKVPLVFTSRRPGDLARVWADPSLAAERLCWSAQKSLTDMCQDSWRWQSTNPGGYSSIG